jgi:hypothetical protein
MVTAPLWPKYLSKILSLSKGGPVKIFKDCQNWSRSDELNKMLAKLEGQIPIAHVLTMVGTGKKVDYSIVLAELQFAMYKMKLQTTLNGVPVCRKKFQDRYL